jgi:hypothetical protein
MEYICHFFAGAFLCNCIPHLVAGLQGAPFPTPFARPRGVGHSSAPVNFLWGAFNLAAGAALLGVSPISIGLSASFFVFAAGFLALGAYLAVHFANVRRRADIE